MGVAEPSLRARAQQRDSSSAFPRVCVGAGKKICTSRSVKSTQSAPPKSESGDDGAAGAMEEAPVRAGVVAAAAVVGVVMEVAVLAWVAEVTVLAEVARRAAVVGVVLAWEEFAGMGVVPVGVARVDTGALAPVSAAAAAAAEGLAWTTEAG
eukprot:500285-Pleurochrysis_carterae.AAC.4